MAFSADTVVGISEEIYDGGIGAKFAGKANAAVGLASTLKGHYEDDNYLSHHELALTAIGTGGSMWAGVFAGAKVGLMFGGPTTPTGVVGAVIGGAAGSGLFGVAFDLLTAGIPEEHRVEIDEFGRVVTSSGRVVGHVDLDTGIVYDENGNPIGTVTFGTTGHPHSRNSASSGAQTPPSQEEPIPTPSSRSGLGQSHEGSSNDSGNSANTGRGVPAQHSPHDSSVGAPIGAPAPSGYSGPVSVLANGNQVHTRGPLDGDGPGAPLSVAGASDRRNDNSGGSDNISVDRSGGSNKGGSSGATQNSNVTQNDSSTTSKDYDFNAQYDPSNENNIGNEFNGVPVLLDLDGNGIVIDGLERANLFVDTDKDGLVNRSAWAGIGDAVLFYDPDNLNEIVESAQFIFTEWDPTAASDIDALRSVFDTNGDGVFSAGDAEFELPPEIRTLT